MSAIVQCWLGGPHPRPPQSSWHFLPKTTEYSSHYKTRKSAHLLSFFPVILQKGTLKQKMLEKGIIFVNTFEKPWHVPFKPVFYLMEVLVGQFMLTILFMYVPIWKIFQTKCSYLPRIETFGSSKPTIALPWNWHVPQWPHSGVNLQWWRGYHSWPGILSGQHSIPTSKSCLALPQD